MATTSQPQPAPLKVLISGAGMAGPALAYWLTRLPSPLRCDIKVIERHPQLRDSGQQIDLRGQGIVAMRRMGIEPAVRAKGVDEQGAKVIDMRGKLQACLEANKTGQGAQGFTSEWEIMRGDLCDILYDLTRDAPNVKYVFGVSVESFTQLAGGRVRVTLSDGSEDEYDLLVGADGIGSRIRKQMFAGKPNQIRSMGIALALFTIPPHESDENFAVVCHLPGKKMILTRRDSPDCLRVTFVYGGHNDELSRALKHGTVQEQKEVYARLFGEHAAAASQAQLPRFLDGMNSQLADDWYTQDVAQLRLDTWSSGNVTLLGDAGYCPTVLTGMGTTLALAGAYVLAGEVARACAKGVKEGRTNLAQHIPAALSGYEKTYKPFVLDVQNSAQPKLFRTFLLPETRWGIGFLQWVAWLIVTLRIDKLASRFGSDDVGAWKLPHYEELGA
ncbi:FAD/NAD(P)-binding domain-containing protein [Canariomyces notabilis]|uniref:FAD/NAD(P)-binding domain-containing protein n=1 Tax=Canariomyces notabilis TaxID=2074819 RepID=A0AAN6T832_9PEZI|nr:FAD/NAD(P)-binding domain-containing protein [Canariomyces arenarius]